MYWWFMTIFHMCWWWKPHIFQWHILDILMIEFGPYFDEIFHMCWWSFSQTGVQSSASRKGEIKRPVLLDICKVSCFFSHQHLDKFSEKYFVHSVLLLFWILIFYNFPTWRFFYIFFLFQILFCFILFLFKPYLSIKLYSVGYVKMAGKSQKPCCVA